MKKSNSILLLALAMLFASMPAHAYCTAQQFKDEVEATQCTMPHLSALTQHCSLSELAQTLKVCPLEAINNISKTCRYTNAQCSEFKSDNCLSMGRDLYYAKVQFVCNISQSTGSAVFTSKAINTNPSNLQQQGEASSTSQTIKKKTSTQKPTEPVTIHY